MHFPSSLYHSDKKSIKLQMYLFIYEQASSLNDALFLGGSEMPIIHTSMWIILIEFLYAKICIKYVLVYIFLYIIYTYICLYLDEEAFIYIHTHTCMYKNTLLPLLNTVYKIEHTLSWLAVSLNISYCSIVWWTLRLYPVCYHRHCLYMWHFAGVYYICRIDSKKWDSRYLHL